MHRLRAVRREFAGLQAAWDTHTRSAAVVRSDQGDSTGRVVPATRRADTGTTGVRSAPPARRLPTDTGVRRPAPARVNTGESVSGRVILPAVPRDTP